MTQIEELKEKLGQLSNEADEIIEVGRNLITKVGVKEYTLFCTGILNRTINLNRGFVDLMVQQNFIAAAPLLRISLDSLLRLFASSQSDYDYETFAMNVRKGMQIKNMKAFGLKKKLTDKELVDRIVLLDSFKWITNVYEVGSGFVHLSKLHITSAMRLEDDKLKSFISTDDRGISLEDKIAATRYMIRISSGIRVFMGDWLDLNYKSE